MKQKLFVYPQTKLIRLSDHLKLKLVIKALVFVISFNLALRVNGQIIPEAPSELTVTTVSSTVLQLEWFDNSSNENSFIIERSINSDDSFEPFAELPQNATSLIHYRLSASTNYHFRIKAINQDGESEYSNTANETTLNTPSELPHYWTNVDIGSPNLEGSAIHEKGFFETKGNGRMNESSNSFNLTYQKLFGDGIVEAQLVNMQQAHWDHQGVIIKESLEPGSQYAMTELYRDDRVAVFKGKVNNEFIYHEDSSQSWNIPIWLRLERVGDVFISSVSNDGTEWLEVKRETIEMSSEALIGLASHASTNDKISTGTWRDVTVSQGAGTIAPPTDLSLQVGLTDEVTLTWVDNSENETGFRIEKATKGDTIIFRDFVEVGSNITSFTEDGLEPGTHFYRVRAVLDSTVSLPTNEETVETLKIQNTILFLPRLAGDYDRTGQDNTITVNTTSDTTQNILRHPGMIGKEIEVELENTFSSLNGSISLKVMPHTTNQVVDFFDSNDLIIRQSNNEISVSANGVSTSHEVELDSVTCNHIVLRFNAGDMSLYVNGTWFDDISVGEFSLNSFTLGEFNGNLWDIQLVNSQLSDDVVHELGSRCTNKVDPLELPFGANRKYRHCGVYKCLWLQNETQLLEERKRAYLVAQDMSFDKNTFDIEMYIQPEIDDWVQLHNDVPSSGFDYFNLNSIFTENQSNTSYWLHENFHGSQVPLYKGGKWLAEASADWAAWNYYKRTLKGTGIAAFTLNPHMGIFETFPSDSENYHEVVRFYHSSVFLAYVTTFLADESIIGELYNTKEVELNAFLTLIKLLEERGYDFDQEFGEFAARTALWDFPNQEMGEDFRNLEKRGITAGLPDYRITETLPVEGNYGVLQSIPEQFLPGAYGWNNIKIDSTAQSTYTIKLKGDEQNPNNLKFIAIVVSGQTGDYKYQSMTIGDDVATGQEEASLEIATDAGNELMLTVIAISDEHLSNENIDFFYKYSIKSSAHQLPNDHILTFELPEENRRAIIDHENFTVNAEVVRGTDASSLGPIITLSEGASSDPENGDVVDFSDPVTYNVTGQGQSNPKEWTVSVSVIPPRTGTDILSFELQDLVPFSTINVESHTISANIVSDIDLTNVVPIFTLSEGASSQPASGQAIDLSSPVTYVVTAEDGETLQDWTISAKNFDPFITTWETAISNDDISISFNGSINYDFNYTWKDSNQNEITSGSFNSETNGVNFISILGEPGTYTLEISGEFPQFRNYPTEKLLDVNQWGDIPWADMSLTFAGWDGQAFSATDQPDLSKVKSMFAMFRNATSFDGDLSEWDVSNITSMSEMFSRALEFSGDLSKWDVGNVISMSEMFREARAFNSDISRWNVSSLLDMTRMFFAATSFDQSLGYWDISNVGNMTQALNSQMSTLNYDRTLIGWSTKNVKEEIQLITNLKYCVGEDARAFLINEKQWIISGDILECPENGESNILFFELDEQTSPANIDDENLTINLEVATTTNSLKPKLVISKGASSSPASEEVVDFTEPKTYTITSTEGNTKEWLVTITSIEVPLNAERNNNSVRIYPNPALNGIFTLELLNHTSELSKMYIYDLTGREAQFTASKAGNHISIHLQEQLGTYLLYLIIDGETRVLKVIKI